MSASFKDCTSTELFLSHLSHMCLVLRQVVESFHIYAASLSLRSSLQATKGIRMHSLSNKICLFVPRLSSSFTLQSPNDFPRPVLFSHLMQRLSLGSMVIIYPFSSAGNSCSEVVISKHNCIIWYEIKFIQYYRGI